jgi:hypothetical protein
MVAGVTATCVLVAFLLVLMHHGRRLAASNTRVIESAFGISLAPGASRCQGGEYVPADAATIRLFTGVAPGQVGQPLVLTFGSRAEPTVLSVHVPGRYAPGPLYIPLPRHQTLELTQLCIRNSGSAAESFAGNFTAANPAGGGHSNGPGERPHDEVRADYYLAGRPSSFSVAGAVVRRASLFRPGLESAAAIWLIVAILVAVLVGAVAFAVRQLSRAS